MLICDMWFIHGYFFGVCCHGSALNLNVNYNKGFLTLRLHEQLAWSHDT